jgi:uracil-DNA glycosylase
MGPLDTNDRSQGRSFGQSLQAALGWWAEAGVDMAFVDEPQDWLAAVASAPAGKAAPALPTAEPKLPRVCAQPTVAPAVAEERGTWPQKFEDFAPWWLSEPSLAPRGAKRLAPLGPQRAALMVLVPIPAEDDGDALLSGRTGKLLDAMLGAMGLDPAAVYRASALPARIALPDWAELGAAGLGAVLKRHIALAAPERMLVFGRSDISALLGHGPAHNAHHLRALNHESGSVAAGFEYDLETLLAKPGWKAGVWQRWLDGVASTAGSE